MNIEIPFVDIKIAQNANDIYDVSFDSDGDFQLDDSYSTSIRASVFLDSRADESEVIQPELRRGWWANKPLYDITHEMGSKLWLLDQKRNSIKVQNDAKGYMSESLQWLIDDKHAKKIEVSASSDNLYELVLTAKITFSADILQTFIFNLWQSTEEF